MCFIMNLRLNLFIYIVSLLFLKFLLFILEKYRISISASFDLDPVHINFIFKDGYKIVNNVICINCILYTRFIHFVISTQICEHVSE